MNRRNWLLQSSLALTGLSIFPFTGFAAPAPPLPEAGYKPGDPIRLNCNENPYGPSPAAQMAMAQSVKISNRYQWDTIGKLMAAIAAKNGAIEDNVLMGAGSTEILDICVQFATAVKGSVVVADPSFSRWADIAEKAGMQKILVPLTADKHIDLPAMQKAIKPDTRMVYICNPNNPTATICDHDALVAFVKEAAKKTLVVVDEAYIELAGGTSLANLAAKTPNLIVVKTFSKIYGLAGSRVGYCIGHTTTIEQLSDQRCAFNIAVSAVTMAGALAALEDTAFLKKTYELNKAVRTYTITEMEKLSIRCIPSNTNFIYFSLANYKKDFFAQLKNNNILGTEIFEEDGKWSRITVGTMHEMQQLIAAIK